MADNTARIAAIDAILEAGAKSVTTDGVTVTYDFDALRTERTRLEASDDTVGGQRPRSFRIDLA